jgi:hypothetical protein
MGEELTLFRAEFNRSLRIETREERITGDSGAILLREVMERLGLERWLEERLVDPRDRLTITHPQIELINTAVLMFAQGWRDQDDADLLRDDPVFRLAVSQRRGVAPLEMRPRVEGELPSRNPPVPDGLASQPTLSRLVRALATEENRAVLRESLVASAARRMRAMRRGHRQRYVTIDVDSLPIVVHGHQPGSAHNGHFHARVYHPLVATAAELGDLLDVQLRPGNAHTAEGALEFILPLLDRVERELCQVAAVRIDAGFPADELLSALEARGTPYVARVKNNPVLDRMAEPHLRRPVGRPPAEPRTWLYEMSYQAQSWSRPRRVVLVVLERPDELFLHHFFLITDWSYEQMDSASLLDLYRQRGTAEGHFGELVNVLHPALSSTPRPKEHYRGREPARRFPAGDSFQSNEVLLLLHALAYNVAHAARVLMEEATEQGWSLERFQERVLRTAARILLHGRRAILILGHISGAYWPLILPQLRMLRCAELK